MFNKEKNINIKKIFLGLLSLMSIYSYSAKLQDVNYRNGEFILTFDSKINNISTNKNDILSTNNINYNVMEITTKNSTIDENVSKTINIHDEYYKQIIIDEISNSTIGIYAYSQYGFNSKVTYENNIIRIKQNKVNVPKRISPLTKKQLVIVLDAGHGGHDSGARGHGKLEKEIALSIVLQLAENLKRDHKVILTRSDDTFIPLSQRPIIGNNAEADLFLSLHLNSSTNESSNGAEIFYFSKETNPYTSKLIAYEEQLDNTEEKKVSILNQILGDFFVTKTKEKSANLAEVMLTNYSKRMGFRRRGVFGANFAVLRGSESASLLIELGFISNSHEASQLASELGQKMAVISIADSIRENFEE